MSLFEAEIQKILPEIVSFRHDLHMHPELGFEELRTADRIAEVLSGVGNLEIQTQVARTGVVALLNGSRSGPCVALRADIDALPITEETGLDYASRNVGRMHACGHDGHTSVLVGAARVLSRFADQLPGKVKFIFQPAEENFGGGRDIVQAGVLDNPKVDAAFALHAWPNRSIGAISMRPGPAMASTDSGPIVIRGQGSHGAYPHRSIDPIVAAAHVIVALQTITSRTLDPLDSGVVTVGAIHGGTIANVIPPECRLEVTLRSLKPETRLKIRERVKQIAESTAAAHGATAEIGIQDGYPMTVNHVELSEWVAGVGREVLGKNNVSTEDPPSMGAEDFSFYSQKVPSVMFRLGIRPDGMETYPALHNPRFNFSDEALPVGIRMFCELTHRFLSKPPL